MALDFTHIKNGHRSLREEAVRMFKKKAMGADLDEFERHLRNGISDKYALIKKRFNDYCKDRSEELFANDIVELKEKITRDFYGGKTLALTHIGSFQAFYEDLNKLKSKFQETGPKFPERNQVLLEICERLIVKLAENIAHSNKQES